MRSFGDENWTSDQPGKKLNGSYSVMDNVLAAFPGQRVGFPLTYLGILIVLGSLRLAHIQPAQDKALAKMAGWQCKLLNQGGGGVVEY